MAGRHKPGQDVAMCESFRLRSAEGGSAAPEFIRDDETEGAQGRQPTRWRFGRGRRLLTRRFAARDTSPPLRWRRKRKSVRRDRVAERDRVGDLGDWVPTGA